MFPQLLHLPKFGVVHNKFITSVTIKYTLTTKYYYYKYTNIVTSFSGSIEMWKKLLQSIQILIKLDLFFFFLNDNTILWLVRDESDCSQREHLPKHTVAAAVHANRMMDFLFFMFLTLPLTNTKDLILFKVFLCMPIDISMRKETAL